MCYFSSVIEHENLLKEAFASWCSSLLMIKFFYLLFSCPNCLSSDVQFTLLFPVSLNNLICFVRLAAEAFFYWRSFLLLLANHFDLYSSVLTNFDSNWALLHPLRRRWSICAVNESLFRTMLFIFSNFFVLCCDRILSGGRMLQMMVSVQLVFLLAFLIPNGSFEWQVLVTHARHFPDFFFIAPKDDILVNAPTLHSSWNNWYSEIDCADIEPPHGKI